MSGQTPACVQQVSMALSMAALGMCWLLPVNGG